MSKLIMWNVITLDGYFEGKQPWDLSFHELIWGPELERFSLEQLRGAGGLVFGRRTYEGMAQYWSQEASGEPNEITEHMNRVPKYVFSRTLEAADWNNSTLISGDAVAELSRLKAQANGDLYVFGSAELSATFVGNRLFDEYRIGIAPVILGSGRPLFSQGLPLQNLSLKSSRQLTNGGMLLTYTP